MTFSHSGKTLKKKKLNFPSLFLFSFSFFFFVCSRMNPIEAKMNRFGMANNTKPRLEANLLEEIVTSTIEAVTSQEDTSELSR